MRPLPSPLRKNTIVFGTLIASFLFAYLNVFIKLIHDWATDGNYSHGFLVVPMAAYFAWQRRAALSRLTPRPCWWGIGVVIVSLAVLAAGVLGAELFLTRVSIVGVIAGTVLFVWGVEHLQVLAFPVALLLLMIPLPAIIFNQIAFPLQIVASRFGELTLRALNVPVLREGNVIVLSNTSLEVADACSGIRSLVSLFTLGLVYGSCAEARSIKRAALAAVTIPAAIVANGLRVAGTGLAAHYLGPGVSEGFFHTFSGWVVFVVAFALLVGVHRMLALIAPSRQVAQVATA
jgi:exosortase